ncbi:MAG: protein kinase [Myxococcota bacterium]
MNAPADEAPDTGDHSGVRPRYRTDPWLRTGPWVLGRRDAATGLHTARHARTGELARAWLLRPNASADAAAAFAAREAALQAQGHRALPTLQGSGRIPDGTRWMLLEAFPGVSLARRLRRGPLVAEEAVALGRSLASALEALHGAGFVHGSLCPEHVLLAPDASQGLRIQLTGFGHIARLDAGGDHVARTPPLPAPAAAGGLASGFVPPERVVQRPMGRASDLWSAGAVLFYALTGRAPFTGGSIAHLTAQLVREPAPSVALYRADAPLHLVRAIAQLLRTCPEHRFRGAEDLGRALAEAASGR